MDTTAEEITFDSEGVCNFCRSFDDHARPIIELARTKEGEGKLRRLVEEIKHAGRNRPYDCLI